MTHPIIHDLNQRYSTKKYDAAKKISVNDIAVIKEALRLSASSVNSQPWRFIVIESDEAKQRLHDTFENKFQNNQQHAKSASHSILFAYNPRFNKEAYKIVVDAEVTSGHLPEAMYDEMLNKGMYFADITADENGVNAQWTKAQTYLALGNALHTLARLRIDSTPMEGVDSEMIGEIFKAELDGYVCETVLALGYHQQDSDYNHGLPKARLPLNKVVITL
ncbi:nitroreductase family protein [Vibrio algarum]|uniref:Nitroreductase family protein n=1 Tax=Vibrio algarum TaxID=3020714 RepID=A0ABT4YUN8_9VIBR|nr:nitroreductase family protein [Vibrio sp. KJ40-1]MDB1125070.1 nitroreductase family protein [Vibrio sp. KJ40-1]